MNAAELVSPPGRPVGPEVLAEIERLALERALGGRGSGHHKHRGRKGIAEGGSLPDTAIGVIYGGAVEVVNLHGKDPNKAMHEHAFDEDRASVWPGQRFRYRRGVVVWDDTPEDDDYWAVDNYFNGPEHITGINHLPVPVPAPNASPEPPNPFTSSDLGVVTAHGEVVVEEGAAFFAEHADAFPTVRDPSRRFRFIKGEVWWSDRPDASSYWAVDNRYGGVRHRYWKGSDLLDVKPPEPTALGDRPGHPFRGNQWTKKYVIGVVRGGAVDAIDTGETHPSMETHYDRFPGELGFGSGRFRYYHGTVLWAEPPEPDDYWAVDDYFGGGLKHEVGDPSSRTRAVKPPKPRVLGGPGSGDKLGHPFRGNQWTDASVDETDLAATKARLDTLHGELSKLSSGPNTAAAIKERLRRNAPLIAEIQRLDHVLHPNTASAITATAVLKPIEGGAFAVHHGGSVLGTLHPIAYTGFSTVNTAQQMRRKTGWKALYGTEVVSGQAATKQAALYAIAWAHSLALKERTLGDKPGHPFRGNQWTGPDPAEDAPQNFDFASQAEQFDRIGPPGISVQREVMPGRTRVVWSRSNLMQGRERKDPDSVIDILKYRDKSGKMLGVLYHYPTGVPGYQSRGSVNVLVSPKAQRQGIATSLLKEGIKRWKIKLEGQSYTSEGRQFIVSYLEKQRRRSLGDKPGHEFHGNQWVHGFALKQYVRHQLVPKFGHVVGEEDDKVVVRWEGGRESAVSPKMIMAVKEPALPEEREKSELEELDED